MGAVPLGLQPLPIDHAAVASAITACHRAADHVRALTDARGRAAARARAEWRGPARDAFDDDVARLDHEAAELVLDLLRAAAGIASTAAEVVRENRRRADRLEAWVRERDRPA